MGSFAAGECIEKITGYGLGSETRRELVSSCLAEWRRGRQMR